MSDYLILIRETERAQQAMALEDMRELVQGHAAYVDRLKGMNVWRDSERLRPLAGAKRVHATRVEAPPFGEDSSLSAYYLVQADSLDAALALAQSCPLAPGDHLEVRPVMGGQVRGEKASTRGKVFAFAVLGSAASEPAWVEVMDRIDDETRDVLPDDGRFLGGVRLQPPTQGRQVEARAGKRVVLDGPFLECKEVIGGIFFMRLLDLDEAVRWARTTRFVRHGSLEIRELWRS